jgi:hypothetical protein
MNAMRCLKLSVVPLLVAVPLMMAGCDKKPEGKYQDPSGLMSIEFKSGKAHFSVAGETKVLDYTVDGTKVSIKSPAGDKEEPMVLTYDVKDETLGGPEGIKLTKKK